MDVNHAVLVVGYDTTPAAEGSLPYWIIKVNTLLF
jgi:C1A family cysteine protease